jgi:hypothetical protein
MRLLLDGARVSFQLPVDSSKGDSASLSEPFCQLAKLMTLLN